MLRNLNELTGRTIEATDGEIGKVVGFYFATGSWRVRYLVAETGSWLMSRDVIIALSSFIHPDLNSDVFPVSLTREQVRRSPHVDLGKPLTYDRAAEIDRYYGWTAPWEAGSGMPPADSLSFPRRATAVAEKEAAARLLGTKEAKDYDVMATDGKAGHVEDFIVDDVFWEIRYLVIDIGGLSSGKKILLPPLWVETVSEDDAQFRVDLSSVSIRNSPDYDPSVPITRTYEDRLYDHYGLPKYWRR